jgi:hypothetical protein
MHTKKPPISGAVLANASGLADELHQAFRRLMVVILNTVFVTNHLPVELIDQLIHCCVQVFVGAFGKQIAAFDMNAAFGALPSLFFLLILD